MLQVALGWELYERTNSALALGLVGLATALPVIILVTRQMVARQPSFGRLALLATNMAIAAIGVLWFTDRVLG